jgi:small subunit ribosomal protein S1
MSTKSSTKFNTKIDAFGDEVKLSNNNEDFASMFERSASSASKKFEKGEKLTGEVISVGKESVFVLTQGQEAIAPRVEFAEVPKVGDSITVYFVRRKNEMFEVTLKASSKALAEGLQDAFDLESHVEGRVTEVCNGGFRVSIMGQTAFCPISQMDSKPIDDASKYLNQKFDFIVTKYEERGRNIVVSRRKVLDLEKAEQEGDFLEKSKEGDIVNGTVTRLEKFGAFVSLTAQLEGLIHISEMAWSRIAHPSEVLQVGQPVQVKILRIEEDDRGRLKISLSSKHASEDPWIDAVKSLSAGQTVQGKIQKQERFGIFVEIRPGVNGLLPREALRESPDEKEILAKKPGDLISVSIAQVNPADKRISLRLSSEQGAESWKDFGNANPGKGLGTLADQFKGLTLKK